MEIRFDQCSYAYGRGKTPALTDLCATIGPGIHLLLGENGAGKTTMLRLIAGLLFPSAGDCTIDRTPTRLRLPSILSKVAFLGENMLMSAATIRGNARCHAPFYPDYDPALLDALLGRFGLTGHECLRDLSPGLRRKSQLAYFIALRPRILLLDEPANGLDIESRQLLQRIIAETVTPEQTVIVSTHTFADLERLYDGLIVVSHGRLLLAAPAEQITRRVAFTSGPLPPAGCFYFEPRLGRAHAITDASQSGDDTGIDYLLLYNALKSEAGLRLASHIMQPLNTDRND